MSHPQKSSHPFLSSPATEKMLHQKSKRERERERENHSSNRSRIASFETRYRSNALRAHARDYYIIDAKNLDNKSRVFILPSPFPVSLVLSTKFTGNHVPYPPRLSFPPRHFGGRNGLQLQTEPETRVIMTYALANTLVTTQRARVDRGGRREGMRGKGRGQYIAALSATNVCINQSEMVMSDA